MKTTSGPKSRSPARPAGSGTTSLLSAPGERDPRLGEGERELDPPARPGREDLRVTGGRTNKASSDSALVAGPHPGRASRQVRARTVCARRARHDPAARAPQSLHPRPIPLRPDPTRPLPRTQPGPSPAPFPAHLSSAAALHLLARSARPVGARTDPPAGTPPAAVTRDATATAAFSSSAEAPAASRGSRSKPHRS